MFVVYKIQGECLFNNNNKENLKTVFVQLYISLSSAYRKNKSIQR